MSDQILSAPPAGAGGGSVTTPKTFVEQLDAARTGEEFGKVLQNLFAALDDAREEAE